MPELPGTGVGRGVAHGPVLRMAAPLGEASTAPLDVAPDEAKQAVHDALAAVAADLTARGAAAGGDAQAVLEAQALMAQDPTLLDDIHARIDQATNPERAVSEAFAHFQEILAGIGGYMGERAADLGDVAQRIIAKLRGVHAPGVPESTTPFILVADDLAPADTALLDLDKVLALVTRDGGPTSHTAILARAKGITAVVGVTEADTIADGDIVLVDAAANRVTTNPTAEQIADADRRIAERAAVAAAPLTPGTLADGHRVPLLANLGQPSEAADAIALGAEGVGLFRTEFLFLDAPTAPTVASQQKSYTELLAAFPRKKVVVRALDAGADKPLPFLTDADEENPALGRRGLRALRNHEPVLRDQLTALAAADAETEADLWVMAPMVADAEETAYFVKLARELGIRTAGVMAEVPSLALVADQVLAEADFVSIGTNDLTQYTMAADRMLGTVAAYQNPWHPAVLRLVAQLGAAGATADKPVGICGEAAADPLLAVVLIGLGATSLSMTPAAIADVRVELAKHTVAEAREMAAAALAASTANAAKAAASAVRAPA